MTRALNCVVVMTAIAPNVKAALTSVAIAAPVGPNERVSKINSGKKIAKIDTTSILKGILGRPIAYSAGSIGKPAIVITAEATSKTKAI